MLLSQLIGALLLTSVTWAGQPNIAIVPSPQSAVEAFDAWLEAHPNSLSLNAQELGTARQLLQARNGELRALMERDPAGFERLALAQKIHRRVPEALQDLVEQPVSGVGSMEVYCILPGAGRAPTSPAAGLQREVRVNGKSYVARVHGHWRDQTTGDGLMIQGVALGDTLVLGESPATATSDPVIAYAPSLTTANTMLYMMARFSDQASDPIDEATALSQMGVVSTFWSNNSSGRVTLKGLRNTGQFMDIVHIVLPQPSSYAATYNSGSLSLIMTDARNAAAALGYTYTDYNLDVVVTTSAGFTYAGRGYVGAQGCHLVAGYTSLRTAGHELGHNLGLQHADYWRTDSCAPLGKDSNPGGYVADTLNAEWVEYGHYYSIMSAQFGGEMEDPAKPHYAPVEKAKLGWLAGSQVQYVSASTTVRLFRHDHPATTGVPRAVRIETAATDYSGYGRRYWLGYRYAPWNTAQSWLRSGVQVDAAQVAYGADGAILLDMTPYSQDDSTFFDPNNKPAGWWTIDNSDKLDAALVVGHTFSDIPAGIHITPVGTGSNGLNEEYIDLVINLGKFAGNRPPVLSGLCASAITTGINQPVTFSVAAADPEGDALAYAWDFEEPQVFTASGLNSPSAVRAWSAPGQYRVMATVSDMKGGVSTASVVVTVGVPVSTNQIWGRVLWGGKPVPGARVATTVAGSVRQGWTGSDGAYTLSDLPGNASYTLTASSPGLTLLPQTANPVAIGSANVYGFDFFAAESTASPAAPGYSISGTVYDPVSPVPGIEVRAGGIATLTDASGNYQFTNFPSGTYTVSAFAPGWTFSPATRTVVISGANVSGYNFGRAATNTLTGVINGISANQTLAPVIYLSNGRSVVTTKAGSTANRYWTYSFANLPNGQYSLSAELPGYSFTPSAFSNPVTLGSGVTTFNFNGTAAATVAGSVSGRVLLGSLPLKGVTVNAQLAGVTKGTALTDADGCFRISNLDNTAYTLVPVLTGYTFSPASLAITAVPSTGNVFSASGGSAAPVITGLVSTPAVVASAPGNAALTASATGTAPLIWRWDVTGAAPAPVTFSANDSAAAASTSIAFTVPGTYTVRARVTDANGLMAMRSLDITVQSGGSGALAITPYEVQLAPGSSLQFRAAAWDAMGTAIPVSPVWSVSGGGSMSPSGLFTAKQSGGPYVVTATGQGLTASASVWVGVTPGVNVTVPRIQSFSAANGAATLNWNTLPGFSYRIDYATDPKGAWTGVSPNVTAAGVTSTWSETLTGPRRFYRVVRLP